VHHKLMLAALMTMLMLGALACQTSPVGMGTVRAQETPKPEPKPAAAVPAGEKTEQGLAFKVPYERGEGSLVFSCQNGLLRVDADVKLPYYGGDAQNDRGSAIDLVLSVDGLNGRHLFYYPSPIWQPSPEPITYRVEAGYSKGEGFKRLLEQPAFGGSCDVKHWDSWQVTLWIDLRLVVVPGSTPASVADSWMAGIVAGNSAARVAFPAGMDPMNPGSTPDNMVKFKFSELPKREELDDNPREEAIATEKAMQEVQTQCTALTRSRDLKGLQDKAAAALKKYPQALWLRFLAYLVALVAETNDLKEMDRDYLPLMKAYLDACPGQTQVHLDYLKNLLAVGDLPAARKHAEELMGSPLCKGNANTEVMVAVRYGATLSAQGFLDAADEIVQKFKDNELIASNKDLRAIYDTLARANLSAQQQWKDELKFREEDAKKTNPRLTVETTQGKFVIELFEDDAPNTTASMVALANAKFFDGLTFHRFVSHFVIQGGCPKGDGTGDPGYRLRSEVNKRNHFRGMVGMACTGPKTNTEGSQFYVCLSDNESVKSLSGKYVIVGRVIEGLEAVEKLRAGDKMTSVKASNLRDHEYAPKKLTD